jgi:hypothetical protein
MPIDDSIVDIAKAIVENDIRGGFDGVLDATGSSAFVFELEDGGLASEDVIATSDSVVVVPWAFHCTHRGSFLGVPATFVELDLRGATFVHVNGEDSDRWILYRYVDYVGALHQMGVSTVQRPVLSPEEYANWLANQP